MSASNRSLAEYRTINLALYAYDVYLLRKYGDDCFNQDGSLRSNVSAEREKKRTEIETAVNSGASFNEILWDTSDEESEAVLKMIPSFVMSDNEDDAESAEDRKMEAFVRRLGYFYDEYCAGSNSTVDVYPPLGSGFDRKCYAKKFGYKTDDNIYNDVYVHNLSERKYVQIERYHIVDEPDGSHSEQVTYHAIDEKNFKPYVMTNLCYGVMNYVKANDNTMFLSQVQELRKLLDFDLDDDFEDTYYSYFEPGGKIETFLEEHQLIDSNKADFIGIRDYYDIDSADVEDMSDARYNLNINNVIDMYSQLLGDAVNNEFGTEYDSAYDSEHIRYYSNHIGLTNSNLRDFPFVIDVFGQTAVYDQFTGAFRSVDALSLSTIRTFVTGSVEDKAKASQNYLKSIQRSLDSTLKNISDENTRKRYTGYKNTADRYFSRISGPEADTYLNNKGTTPDCHKMLIFSNEGGKLRNTPNMFDGVSIVYGSKNDRGTHFRFSNAFIVNSDARMATPGEDATAEERRAVNENNYIPYHVLGRQYSMFDACGLSELSKYMPTDFYRTLSGTDENEYPTLHFPELLHGQKLVSDDKGNMKREKAADGAQIEAMLAQRRASENAAAILETLNNRGIEYNLKVTYPRAYDRGINAGKAVYAELPDYGKIRIRLVYPAKPNTVGVIFGSGRVSNLTSSSIQDFGATLKQLGVEDTGLSTKPLLEKRKMYDLSKPAGRNGYCNDSLVKKYHDAGYFDYHIDRVTDKQESNCLFIPSKEQVVDHLLYNLGEPVYAKGRASDGRDDVLVGTPYRHKDGTVNTWERSRSQSTYSVVDYNESLGMYVGYRSAEISDAWKHLGSKVYDVDYNGQMLRKWITTSGNVFQKAVFDGFDVVDLRTLESHHDSVANSKDSEILYFQENCYNYVVNGTNRALMLSEDPDEPLSRSERLAVFKDAFESHKNGLFGSFAKGEDSVYHYNINVPRVVKYANVVSLSLFRCIQVLKENEIPVNISADQTDASSPVVTQTGMYEKTVIYDKNNVTDLGHREGSGDFVRTDRFVNRSDFMKQVTTAAIETISSSGLLPDVLEMDRNGILHYVGRKAVTPESVPGVSHDNQIILAGINKEQILDDIEPGYKKVFVDKDVAPLKIKAEDVRESVFPAFSNCYDVTLGSTEMGGVDSTTMELFNASRVYYSRRNVSNDKLEEMGLFNVPSFRIEGYIGQIFEPDERGVVITRYNHDGISNYNNAIVPGIKGTIVPGTGPYTERTYCRDFEDTLLENLKFRLRHQIAAIDLAEKGVSHNPADKQDYVALNSVYRHLIESGERFEPDYENMHFSRGQDLDTLNAKIDTLKNTIRYSKDYMENSTLFTTRGFRNSLVIDDLNTDPYSKTRCDMSILSNASPYVFTPGDTSTGTRQGISRVLSKGARIDHTTHHIIPSDVAYEQRGIMDGMHNEYAENNPKDRLQMSYSNAKSQLFTARDVYVAHTDLKGFTMDDGYVVTKAFADSILIETDDVDEIRNMDPDIYSRIITSTYGDISHKRSIDFRGSTYDIDPDLMDKEGHYVSTGQQLKDQIISRMGKPEEDKGIAVGYRTLTVLDKLLDHSGNKGVICQIVDTDMTETEAELRNIKYLWEFFRVNPKLQVVGASYTAPSRFNMGTVRTMLQTREPLIAVHSDGTKEEISGGMGREDLIVTDKTIDNKAHIYDLEDSNSGVGRKVSSQGIWLLQSSNCNKFLSRVFSHNYDNVMKVRELLIATGRDFDDNYNLTEGYSPHMGEERPVISIKSKIKNPLTIQFNARGAITINSNRLSLEEAQEAVSLDVSIQGGFLESPFPIDLGEKFNTRRKNDYLTKADSYLTLRDEESGHYLFPVLPAFYRVDQTDMDGSPLLHDYNSSYINIINHMTACEYEKSCIELLENEDEFRKVASDFIKDSLKDPESDKAKKFMKGLESNKYTKAVGGSGQERLNKQIEVLTDLIVKKAPDKVKTFNNKEADHQYSCQKTYGEMKKKIDSLYFSGKYNLWKSGFMSRKIKGSATLPVGADPRLDLDEIMISSETAYKLNTYDGDVVLNWRDPLLRPENMAAVRICVQKETDPIQIKGMMMNPVVDTRYEGDFDGDAYAVISLNSTSRVERGYYKKNLSRYNDLKHTVTEEGIDALSVDDRAFYAKMDGIKAKIDSDQEVKDELYDNMSIANTLYDRALTPMHPESADQIELSLNFGLDMASAKAVLAKENPELAQELDEKLAEAKKYIFQGMQKKDEPLTRTTLNQSALSLLNDYTHTMLDYADARDTINYKNVFTYFDSLNTIIVDHKAKGKVSKFEDIAAYLNVYQELDPEYIKKYGDAVKNDRMHYIWHQKENDGVPVFDEKGKPVMEKERIDLSHPIIDVNRSPLSLRFNYKHDETGAALKDSEGNYIRDDHYYRIHPDGHKEALTPDSKYEALCQTFQKDMKDRARSVEQAMAIKSFVTGVAGKYSQRLVESLRDVCMGPGIEMTYGSTQAIVQAKHDAVDAKRRAELLLDVFPELWRGHAIEKNIRTGEWQVSKDERGRYVPVTSAAEWAKQCSALFKDDQGLTVEIADENVREIADALYFEGKYESLTREAMNDKEKNSETIKVNIYEHNGSTLDVLAYAESDKVLDEMCRQHRNLFDAPIHDISDPKPMSQNKILRPDDPDKLRYQQETLVGKVPSATKALLRSNENDRQSDGKNDRKDNHTVKRQKTDKNDGKVKTNDRIIESAMNVQWKDPALSKDYGCEPV